MSVGLRTRLVRLVSDGAPNGWTGGQYSLFRVTLGAYLAVHFAHLLPWAAETFSGAGMLPHSADSPLSHLFPNILALADSPALVQALIALGVALSVLLALGWHDRPAAVGLWYLLACLFGRNPLTNNPSLPYVGWILLAHAVLPGAPYGSLGARGRTDPGWRFPRGLFAGAWVLMAVGYTYSGCMKVSSPSWLDGSALARVLENPLARPSFLRDALLACPAWALRASTWSALALELLFAPLALFRRTRPWVWLAMLGMHLGLLAVVSFADLSMGMLVLHLFTFNPAWIRPRPTAGVTLLFFDGECALCHGFVRFVASGELPLRPASGGDGFGAGAGGSGNRREHGGGHARWRAARPVARGAGHAGGAGWGVASAGGRVLVGPRSDWRRGLRHDRPAPSRCVRGRRVPDGRRGARGAAASLSRRDRARTNAVFRRLGSEE